MANYLQRTFEILTQLHFLPAGSAARVIKFLMLVADVVSLMLLVISILIFVLVKNRLAKRICGIAMTVFLLFFLAQATLYVDMAFIEPNWIKVEHVKLHIPRLAPALKGVKIVHFSDLHTLRFGFRERQLIKKINAIQPDIVLFTGGFTGEDLKNLGDAVPEAAKVFGALKPQLGIWAATDDTDDSIFHDDPKTIQLLKDAGVRFLDNDAVKFADSKGNYFWLIGTEDVFYGKSGLNKAMLRIPAKAPKIMITHSPNIIDEATEYGFDLVLVGKTHGGHTGIKALRDASEFIRKFKYIAGLYKVKDTYLYVNRGIGGKTSPYRLLCRPELTVYEIVE
ncbi:MAG: metallophosphoesterase [Candidatus Omnitrophota bacterium]